MLSRIGMPSSALPCGRSGRYHPAMFVLMACDVCFSLLFIASRSLTAPMFRTGVAKKFSWRASSPKQSMTLFPDFYLPRTILL
ncbi:hypothetical protein BX600DRAFT_450967 [Xylariales sp. PMI_506]|nr:hypothetical protein BX600DRAFT_450967 [Xylariales sp. PMI_506]